MTTTLRLTRYSVLTIYGIHVDDGIVVVVDVVTVLMMFIVRWLILVPFRCYV